MFHERSTESPRLASQRPPSCSTCPSHPSSLLDLRTLSCTAMLKTRLGRGPVLTRTSPPHAGASLPSAARATPPPLVSPFLWVSLSLELPPRSLDLAELTGGLPRAADVTHARPQGRLEPELAQLQSGQHGRLYELLRGLPAPIRPWPLFVPSQALTGPLDLSARRALASLWRREHGFLEREGGRRLDVRKRSGRVSGTGLHRPRCGDSQG